MDTSRGQLVSNLVTNHMPRKDAAWTAKDVVMNVMYVPVHTICSSICTLVSMANASVLGDDHRTPGKSGCIIV